MSLCFKVSRIDESKGDTEDNLDVQIGYVGIKPNEEPLTEEKAKELADFVRGVVSGRIKTKPLTAESFKDLPDE